MAKGCSSFGASFDPRWEFAMRFFEPAVALCFALAIASCATSLHDDGNASSAASDASPPPPVAKGCLPFHGTAHVQAIGGSLHTLASRGAVLVIADDATIDGSDVPSIGMSVPPLHDIDDCLVAASFANGSPQSVLSPSSLSAMAPVVLGDTAWTFFSQPFVGIGVAQQDLTKGLFLSSGSLLFTDDRPAYGTAAVLADENVYAYGCVGARFLDADCYVARVPPASISDESQYSFYTGGGHWSPRIEDAWPMTSAGTSIDVVFIAGRYLMLYVQPLGTVIRARYGVAPEGPWSAPIDLATCDLADSDMFCGGINAHPDLTSAPGTIAISYAIGSLSSDAGARRAQNPDAWWPRLLALPIPAVP
jgi:hypothetical protein